MKTPPDLTHPWQAIQRITSDLRDPNGGCPWDIKQTHQSLTPNLIEEAYEVADAIENFNEDNQASVDNLKEELGDLLFQSILHAQIASEKKLFTADDIVLYLAEKIIYRHPHVYGEEQALSDSEEVLKSWEKLKLKEKQKKSGGQERILDSIPKHLPALMKAHKLGKKASRFHFDWPEETAGKMLREKIEEELEEFTSEIPENPREFVDGICGQDPGRKDRAEEELGDLLFTIAQWARHYGLDPEKALQTANDKFTRRFTHMEERVTERLHAHDYPSADEWEELWQEAKASENNFK